MSETKNVQFGFAHYLVKEVLAQTETVTYRLGRKHFDKLSAGQILDAVDSTTGKVFAQIKIEKVELTAIKDAPLSQAGHRSYQSHQELLKNLRTHYPQEITLDSDLSMVYFSLV